MRAWRSALLVAGVSFIAAGMRPGVGLWATVLGACLLSTFVFTQES